MSQVHRRVSVTPSAVAQEFLGWGTSLAWFANHTGDWHNREQLADLLFRPPAQGPSLGLNIARYDIGGGDNPAFPGWMRPGADVPSWRADPDGDYDWDADPRQRWWLRAAADRAGSAFIADAIAYSAPWWMTRSRRSNGHGDGTEDNLLHEHEATYAAYLADVVAHIRRHDGIEFRSLSPLNEPGTAYWTSAARQEGMHVSPGASQRRVLDATYEALRARRLPTGLSAVDETGVDQSLTALEELRAAGLDWDRIDQVNVHTYLPGDRRRLHDLVVRARGKRLQMSEVTIPGGPYAPAAIEPSLAWAAHMTTDLRELRPSEYVYWQAMEAESEVVSGDGNWGFLHYGTREAQTYSVTKKFHAMRQYTGFIRPGSTFVWNSDDAVVSAIDAADSRLTLVVYNDSSAPAEVSFDVSSFHGLGATAQAFRTSQHEDVHDAGETPIRGGELSVTLSPRSITTLLLTASAP